MASPTPINWVFKWMLDEQDPVEEMMDFLTDSDEEVNLPPKNTCGPSKDHRRFEGDQKLYQDYFAKEPVDNDQDFKRKFPITKSLFLKIRNQIVEHDPYFLQKQSENQPANRESQRANSEERGAPLGNTPLATMANTSTSDRFRQSMLKSALNTIPQLDLEGQDL
ncbi:hypothetical protein PCANC_08297 [Puccinia coronata f. sp. avenae]|uniref:Uncharacterized protein n=1 Tax=Puccinia coronata f. sp. avenae TaxID=200324 RepID=A0A2N5T0R8_9BASI|nr:hypothetical protein PCANC_08297 [Puccinia coronata f. sp. avenae]